MRTYFILLAICFSFSSFKPLKKAGGGDFDVYHPDYNYLNELVIEKINAKRQLRNEVLLARQSALDETALYLTRDLKLSRLQRLMSDRRVMQKKVALISWKKGYPNNLLMVIVTMNHAVNYDGGKFYFDKKDTETTSHLYYGDKPSKKEMEKPGFRLVPVKDFTYDQLAEMISHKFLIDKRSFKCLNAGYDLVGCSCIIEQRTLNHHKIPMIKAVFILGGKRINF